MNSSGQLVRECWERRGGWWAGWSAGASCGPASRKPGKFLPFYFDRLKSCVVCTLQIYQLLAGYRTSFYFSGQDLDPVWHHTKKSDPDRAGYRY